jgi:RNA polymerase sigma factor (sigma-70 family)
VRTASIPARIAAPRFRSKRLLGLARDERLVEQIRRGNEAAFEVAFERHAPGILAFSRHMLGSQEEAEDVVQHTFAAAFRDLGPDDRREVALKAWLYAVARNRCVSLLRARRERASEGFDVATVDVAEKVERRAELHDLLRDLRELPEEQREALLLSEAGDLSHAEVAKVLGCEVARVKALVFRARTGLIQRRAARETPCEEIREQLANLSGGALRRSGLRHHVRHCAGCRAYRDAVAHQRRMLAVALPVAPSLALKSSVLGAVGIGGGSAGGGLAAGLTGLGASASAPLGGASALGGATAAKVALVGVLAAGGTVAGKATLDDAPNPRGGEPPAAAVAPQPARESLPGAPASPTSPKPRADRSRGGHGPRTEPRAGAGGAGDPPVEGRPTAGIRDAGGKKARPARRGHLAKRPGQRRGPGVRSTKHAPDTGRQGGRGPMKAPPAATRGGRGPIEAPPAATGGGRGPSEAPPTATPVRRAAPEPPLGVKPPVPVKASPRPAGVAPQPAAPQASRRAVPARQQGKAARSDDHPSG